MQYPFLTKKDLKVIPKFYETEDIKSENLILQVKLFTPFSNWTWYIIEFDGDDLCYGYVIGQDREFGYFSLKELASIRNANGLRIERDRYFEPIKFKDLKNHS